MVQKINRPKLNDYSDSKYPTSCIRLLALKTIGTELEIELQAEMYCIFEFHSNEFLSPSLSLQEMLSQADELTCDYKLVRLFDDETTLIKQVSN